MLGQFDIVTAGEEIGEATLLFEKIEDPQIEAQIKRLEDNKKANALNNWKPEPQLPDVDFEKFMKADIRVGTVMDCSRVPKADKLLKFVIDDGNETRTIVSGIAAFYQPEDLIGKQVCFISNLPTRRLKGVDSQGMILSAQDSDGRLVVISPSAPVRPGSRVK